MSKLFKDWDSFDIGLAITLTVILFPYSMIYWIICIYQDNVKNNR